MTVATLPAEPEFYDVGTIHELCRFRSGEWSLRIKQGDDRAHIRYLSNNEIALVEALRQSLSDALVRAEKEKADADKGRRVVGAIAIACHRLGIDFTSIQTEMHRVMKEADDAAMGAQ